MSQAIVNTTIVQPTKSEDAIPQVLFKILVQVRGVKKRCRKSEVHNLHLGSIPYNDGSFDLEAVTQTARSAVATNMKEVHSVCRIHLDHVIVTKEGGFTSTQWQPFSELNKRFDFNF